MNKQVSAFVKDQPKEFHTAFTKTRELILSCSSDIEETIKYGVPFYLYRGKRLAYLNPQKYGFNIGLAMGVMLSNKSGLLTGTGKEVRLIPIRSESDVVQDIRGIIEESMFLFEL